MAEVFIFDDNLKTLGDTVNLDIRNIVKIEICYEDDIGDGIIIDLRNNLFGIQNGSRVDIVKYDKILLEGLYIEDFMREKCKDQNWVGYIINNSFKEGFWFRELTINLDNKILKYK